MAYMVIGAIIIGDEILSGRRQDKHFSHVVECLAQHGMVLDWVRYAGDDETLLTRHFSEIRASGDVCFSFGGIGATPDDCTRQAVAHAFNVPLLRHKQAVKEIEAKFGDAAYPNRILMAELPEGSDIVPNPYNRVPGFTVERIHCFPGFPEMAWPMLDWVLKRYYQSLFSEKVVLRSLILFDVHESDLIELMQSIQERFPSVKLSSLPRFLPDNKRRLEIGLQGKAHDVQVANVELENALKDRGCTFKRN
jgi:molybdopterin-biosynthesis enzyme MoeA-like protein